MLRFQGLSAMPAPGLARFHLTLCLAALGGLAVVSASAAYAGPLSAQSAQEPLKLVVSLQEQRMDVYRGTRRLHTSRVSTGKRGYSTPSGVYSILEKRRWHRSNIYSGAPMPFMQRLTWSGIALHAGHVPNYPASHGCIRLPRGFASKLFQKTEVGAHVVITREHSQPQPVSHQALLNPRPLRLVTMDAKKALRQRLAVERGDRVSIALPARAMREQKVASLARPHDSAVMTDAVRGVPAQPDPEPMSAREGALYMADLEHDMFALESYVARPDEPVRVLITRRVGRERIRDVQMLLNELGYDAGPVDGYMGRQTGAAIKAFQEARELKATGAFSEELRDKLFMEARGEPAPSGHLYVRRGFKPVFDVPVGLKDPDAPIGTHFYFVLNYEPTDERARWVAITTEQAEGADPVSVLDRVSLPEDVRMRVEAALTPGSSLIISDEGLGRETGRGTDFVVTH